MKYNIKILRANKKPLYFTEWVDDVINGHEDQKAGKEYETKEEALKDLNTIKTHERWNHLLVNIIPKDTED